MNTFPALIPDALTDALGWTILHSIWQGIFIALIAFLILGIRRKATPQFKYLVGILALTAILASSIVTFVSGYKPDHGFAGAAGAYAAIGSFEVPIQIKAVHSLTISNLNSGTILHKISQTFPWLSALWLLGVMILSARLAGGMILVNRLRTRKISLLPSNLENRFRILIRKSCIRRAIRIRVSGWIRVPTVIGVLKPVILIPAGIVSLMPVDQLESILAHEIAHIRRYDFLVNIFQSIMEALFFYHPAVWMLSERIRRERENCCDDFAVSLCGKPFTYARALAGLGEMHVRTTLPSVALTGKNYRIIHRVERLIKPRKMKTNAVEKIIAGLLILGSAVILTLHTGASLGSVEQQQGASLQGDLPGIGMGPHPEITLPAAEIRSSAKVLPPLSVAEPAVVPVTEAGDTLVRDVATGMDVRDNVVTREFINKNGERIAMRFVIRKGEVKELYVNGEEVPESEFPKYEKEIDRTMTGLREMDRDLRKARKEIAETDWEEIQRDVEADMEHFRQFEMQKLQEEMKLLQQEQIEMQIDQHKLQEEITRAMEESMKALEDYQEGKYALSDEQLREMEKAMAVAMEQAAAMDEDRMREMFEIQLQAIQDVDFEKIQRDIETAMKEIDLAEIEKTFRESMKQLELERLNLDREVKHIDEMIRELEKLELRED